MRAVAGSSAPRRPDSRRCNCLASTEVRPRRRRRPPTNGSGPRTFMTPTPGVAEPFRLTPQIALRIAILGGITVAVFGVLFFRLWALEVLSGPQYLHAAVNNQLRSIPLEAPRGPVLDREGRTIVDNRAATAVQLWTADLPQKWAARLNELRRLSKIIKVPVREMVAELKARYDAYLRGNDRLAQLRVDALGRPRSGLITEQKEQPGEAVRMTLDMNLP